MSLLLQIDVGLSQTNAGRHSSNVRGVNTLSWHDTRCQRLQTSVRRKTQIVSSFSLPLPWSSYFTS